MSGPEATAAAAAADGSAQAAGGGAQAAAEGSTQPAAASSTETAADGALAAADSNEAPATEVGAPAAAESLQVATACGTQAATGGRAEDEADASAEAKMAAEIGEASEEEAEDEAISREDLVSMRVSVLRTLCKSRKLPDTGAKDELVDRLHASYIADPGGADKAHVSFALDAGLLPTPARNAARDAVGQRARADSHQVEKRPYSRTIHYVERLLERATAEGRAEGRAEAQAAQEALIAAAEKREQALERQVEAVASEARKQSAQLETAQQQIQTMREELARTKALLEAKTEQATQLSQDKSSLQIAFDSYKEHHGTTSEQQMGAITELKCMVGDLSKQVEDKKMEVVVHENNVIEGQSQIQELQRRLADEERRRREMHNAMQELKGNIRVFCRARPPQDGSPVAMQVSDAANTMNVRGGDGEFHEFSYDKVFGFTSSQEDVFDEFSGVVQSALDGYKVCIFAYGQTGSGKTYTMQGEDTQSGWGVIPRSLSQIFRAVEEMRGKGWTWTLQASFMEVYNEAIRDLLDDGSAGDPPVYTIVHDEAWGSVVNNMTAVPVDSMDQIRSLVSRASKQRSVGNTDMNAQSSRSHAIFALYLKGANESLNTELTGALHLVDLAGSERLDKSNATGARLKESCNINKSLSALVDVFVAKSERNRKHVPFRNSKLTHLMAPCLNGNGKTMMVVNVGPEDLHSHETLCSLKFANQVSQCNTGGKPTRTAKVIGGLEGATFGPSSSQASASSSSGMSARLTRPPSHGPSSSQASASSSSGMSARLTRPPSPKSRPATPPVRRGGC